MFVLDDDLKELQAAAREASQQILAETARMADENEEFDKGLFTQLGEAGLCGIPTSEELGGLGMGYLEYAVALEEIAKVSASYAVTVAVNGLPQIILSQYGSRAQQEKYTSRLAAGEWLGAFALSEVNSGSDAGSLKTTAVRDGDSWVLNGSKMWITHGGVADLYVVMARTGGPGPRGVSAFLVEGSAVGLTAGKKEEKMGLRASPTAEILLEDVRIPYENLVGKEGEGFKVAMSALDSGRITIGASAVGVCQAAIEVAAPYACQREQFGKAIIDFQGVGFMLADMAKRTEASRLLVHKAAWMRDQGMDYSTIAAMAKCEATDASIAVTTDAVQVLGGNGYTREYPLERYMRDAKVMQIVEGTNQIQRLVISRHIKRNYKPE